MRVACSWQSHEGESEAASETQTTRQARPSYHPRPFRREASGTAIPLLVDETVKKPALPTLYVAFERAPPAWLRWIAQTTARLYGGTDLTSYDDKSICDFLVAVFE